MVFFQFILVYYLVYFFKKKIIWLTNFQQLKSSWPLLLSWRICFPHTDRYKSTFNITIVATIVVALMISTMMMAGNDASCSKQHAKQSLICLKSYPILQLCVCDINHLHTLHIHHHNVYMYWYLVPSTSPSSS